MNPLFGMLGPLKVAGRERPPSFGGRRQRAVFLDLLIHANEVVEPDALIDDVWDQHPPGGAATTVKVYVSHLRRALSGVLVGGQPAAAISTSRPGYLLAVDPELIDAYRFERLTAQGGRELVSAPAAATRSLQEALELWRGPALADVAAQHFARPEAARLDELRLTAFEWRIEADLSLGRHAEVIGDLEVLVRRHPLHEGFWAQLMRALHGAGRRGEALRVYQLARRTLGEELGIDPSAFLQDLEQSILLQHESALPSAAVGGSNLVVAATSFVGRSSELDELEALLAERRLVTIVGEGGSGKTRLATEVAGRLASPGGRGPWLVELAPLTNLNEVTDAIRGVVGVGAAGRLDPMTAVVDVLGDNPALIVLDNCEHLIDDVAGPVEELLRRCPGLRILATSRSSLDVPGEVVWRIPALAVPPSETHLNAVTAIRFDAVRLLVERARSGDPRFTLTDEQVPAVCTICRRLDGLPLALELAAARLRVLSLDEVAERLDDRFRLLGTVGRSTVSARQRSLRAAVEWSYDLLSPAERLLFQRLSVFAGSFSVPDVEAVCAGGGLEARDVVDLLGNLVAKSLVVRVARISGPARFRMLETLRLYAHSAWLSASGEDRGEGGADARIGHTPATSVVFARHAAWFSDRCEQAALQRTGPGRRSWLQRLDEERDDWRAALAWLVAEGEPDGALRLATSLWRYWDHRSLTTEGRTWLDRALACPGGSLELRRRALAGAAYLALVEDDLDVAQARCDEGLDLLGGEQDPAGRAALLAISGEAARLRGGQTRLATELCGRAQELFSLVGDAWGEADALRVLVLLAWDGGDLDRARQLGERCLELWDRCGDTERCAGARSMLAGVARDSGDLDTAAVLYEESLAQFRRAEEPWGTAQMIRELGVVALAQGRYERAHHLGEECLAMEALLGKRRVFALALRLMADAAVQLGRLEDADRYCAEALGRFREHQLERDVLLTLRTEALIALCRGDLDRAVALAEAAGRDPLSLRVLGTAICRQGRPDQGTGLLAEGLRVAREANDARSEASVLDALAEVAVMTGAFADAAAKLLEAEKKRRQAGVSATPVEVADRRRTLARLADGQPDAAAAVSADEEAGADIVIDLRSVPTQTVDVEGIRHRPRRPHR